jgi:hypothetical protein
MDVTFEAVLLPAVVFENALDLLLDLEDVWRQQALQPERGALGFGERRALVEERIAKQGDPPRHVGRKFRVVLGHHRL